MGAGTECHTGIHQHRDLLRCGIVGFPHGHDHQPLAGLDGLIVFLPGVRPVVLTDAAAGNLRVDAALIQAGTDIQLRFSGRFLIGNKHGHGRRGAILLQQILVDQVTVHAVQILFHVGKVLDHKGVVDHAHNGGNGIQMLTRRAHADANPVFLFHISVLSV